MIFLNHQKSTVLVLDSWINQLDYKLNLRT